jgi:microcystin-dependent protein
VGILQDVLNLLVPAGKLDEFAGTTAPTGWLVADGSAYSRATYSRLFSAIGTTWGAGDGSTTFNVPNLQRRTTVGAGGTGTGTLANTVGATGGEETHALTTAELAAHNHSITVNDPGHAHGVTDPTHAHAFGAASNIANGGGSPSAFNAGTTASTQNAATGISINAAATGITASSANNGSGTAHNNMQPSAVVLKCIKY